MKKERENEVLSKMRKLDSFVSPGNDSKVTNSSNDEYVESSKNVMTIVNIEKTDILVASTSETTTTSENDCMDVNKSHEITDNNESRNSENDCIDVDISHEITDNYESHNSEIQNKEVFPIISNDPAKWILNDFTIEYLSTHNIQQNINVDFDFGNSKRYYGNTSRTLTKNVFERRLLNGEIMPRKYLIYSESKGAVFCAPCRLFGGTSSLATNGYDDWKNVEYANMKIQLSTKHVNLK
ncbi:zinc finger MYM-type protein 5-like [Camponotus floridanus]|uniref:zinc finger MYM-type protein 5-like n=1 Tax=Camponotus floridanus TaxID=104421 RepID=UPI000DC6796B|nr:zinc finger MYM-type protein 5-like [Camponotus floridanus]